MSMMGSILKLLHPRPTMTEDLMMSIGTALAAANPGALGPETIEAARLLSSLQRTAIYTLDEKTALFIDSQAKELFACDAEVAEIVPDGASLVIEYPYRPALKAKKAKHKMSTEEETILPLRMGVLIQRVQKRVYAGLIVGHRAGPKPPPVMADISDLTCPLFSPFWNKPVTLKKLRISTYADADCEQEILDGLGQDILEELAFALAFVVMAESAKSPLIMHPGHPSGFGPVRVEMPISQARYRDKCMIARKDGSLDWMPEAEADTVASKLASLRQYIEENITDEAAPTKANQEVTH